MGRVKVLITGGTGMLGTDVARAALAAGHEVRAPSRGELDITNLESLARLVEREAPAVVVNCAAYTNVDGAEDDLESAMAVNAGGARHVSAAAAAVGALVVYPSTDYVFDGTKGAPYVESDATRPLSLYARSKLAGEHETAEANPRHLIVRTSWLFGTAARNFVETMLFLAADQGHVRVVDDQVGCPTYTAHLSQAIMQAATTELDGVLHVAGAGECSWFEFAQAIFDEAGVECRVEPCTTAEFPRAATRPAYSVLRSERGDAPALPAWRDGLRAYLAERKVAA